MEVGFASSENHIGDDVAWFVPSLAKAYPTLTYSSVDDINVATVELIFCALPHGASQDVVHWLRSEGRLVIDLGADYRLKDAADYTQWYGFEHRHPELLREAAYGLVERHRADINGAALLAIPGCYPTASALALGPFVDAGWLDRSHLIVNALSGTSGAGRALNDRLHASRVIGNLEAYSLLTHRHTIEIERELNASVTFTPHLAPVSRGMLVTAYGQLTESRTTEDAMELLHHTYDNEPFIEVTDEPPTLKDPLGSNLCFVSARVDERTNTLIAMSSIDNLVKGAAGQAIQAINLALGWPEGSGLPTIGITP